MSVPLVPLRLRVKVRIRVGSKIALFSGRDLWTLGLVDMNRYNKYELLQMDPRDALPHADDAVYTRRWMISVIN